MPRLKSRFRVQAMIRLAEHQGGGGMVLHRGEESAGDIALILQPTGGIASLYQRLPGKDFMPEWTPLPAPDGQAADAPDRLERLKSRDPDLWIVEIIVPKLERFVEEISSLG